jgi:hypothetical protein
LGICADTPGLNKWVCDSSLDRLQTGPYGDNFANGTLGFNNSLSPEDFQLLDLLDSARSHAFQAAGDCIIASIAITAFLAFTMFFIVIASLQRREGGDHRENRNVCQLEPRLLSGLLLLFFSSSSLAFLATAWQHGASSAALEGILTVLGENATGERNLQSDLQMWIGSGFLGAATLLVTF